ncbi:M6 family metalloprotease domain-containing protein [Streptomyces sp. ME08-AFT2]|uniref:M6 family metalloprotease domain-containing protein n=1 Tax=Streptomyces sp. ME08-AFT2 TaxID=3028683 RepID=UPI0029BD300F|nr:M6 family metalloprotease domain-containing protein [Streptomyces sp. ME08-AFT2]MDX3310781.1 M6 family metalloprotease domain-containing protein [Streptomyces sp. ME08-AFT2]
MSREPPPEVFVPRLPRPVRLLPRPRLRGTASVFTTLTALAATSLIGNPSVAEPFSAEPCALARTAAHHSEGLDTWNAAYPRPARSLDAVMVFLSFPDWTPLPSPAELAADHFPATSRFFEQASYGRFTLRSHPLKQWIRMPKPSTAYAIRRDWSPEGRAAYLHDALAAADPHVDFSRYAVVYFVADPDAPGVDSDATKVVNLDDPLHADGTDIRRVVTVFEKHPPDRLVLAHETGHVFDLPDLYHRPVDGKGDWDTYVGDWDLMGSQFGLAPDLFAWHKWKLGWLDPRQVLCLRKPGPTRLTLEPLAAAPGTPTAQALARPPAAGSGEQAAQALGQPAPTPAQPPAPEVPAPVQPAPAPVQPASAPPAPARSAPVPGGGARLAVVRTGPDSALAFEARGPVGNDRAACRAGILVYRVSSAARSGRGPVEVLDAHPRTEACWENSVYPPLADAPVALGESFTVPGDGVRVDVESRSASGAWTLRITPRAKH